MNSMRSNSLSLNFQRFTPLGCKYIKIRKFEFVAINDFLYINEYKKQYLHRFTLGQVHHLALTPGTKHQNHLGALRP